MNKTNFPYALVEFIRRVKGNRQNKFIILSDGEIHEVVVESNGEWILIR